ncbi:COX15/CtaA family protein [Planctomycetota bacterium]|nr:COX15/CtaA family protein [Planctomycetota bacterium]
MPQTLDRQPDSARLQASDLAPAAFPWGAVVTLAFATTVAMWTVGYVGRLPFVMAPSALIGVALMACLLSGGFLAGRQTTGGVRAGLVSGALCSAINLLILGSVLADLKGMSAAVGLPGFVVAGALLSGLGAWAAGQVGPPQPRDRADWPGLFCRVAAVATLLIMSVGGLVTSHDAGLAVPDWPNSFGTNMFLYPLSKMTGGVYYEHAHRLFGSLVGLTTVVMAVFLWATESRKWVRGLAVLAVVLVIAQGIMGGLRVTGELTLATDRADLYPQIALAISHGVTAQAFLGLVVALAAFTSPTWRSTVSVPVPRLGAETVLLGALLLQLILGAILRHLHAGAVFHVTFAAAVLLLATGVGVRAWSKAEQPVLPRTGRALTLFVWLQVTLGVVALAAVTLGEQAARRGAEPLSWEAAITTSHQTLGAAVLATAVLVRLWTGRAPASTALPEGTPA